MTILVPYRGIIEIVGEHDVGKTIAAMQTVYPLKNTVFVDDDVKGDGTVRQMAETNVQIGEYIDLRKERSKLVNTPTPDDLLKIVYSTVEKIASKKREVIIWDTWRIVREATRGHVERNQSKYSSVVNFRGNSQIVQGLISKVARMLEAKQLSILKDACDLLVITHHITDRYANNIVVGKVPESSKVFDEVCNVRMWLRRNPQSKVPIILFLKRPSLPKISKGKMKFANIVPLKITPTADDESIWDAIKRYEDKPIESRKPREDEMPTQEEYAAISGTLTKEQQQYAMEMMKYNQQAIDEVVSAIKPTKKSSNGNAPDNIVLLLSRSQTEYGLDADGIAELVGITIEELMSANIDDIGEYWMEIETHAKNKSI